MQPDMFRSGSKRRSSRIGASITQAQSPTRHRPATPRNRSSRLEALRRPLTPHLPGLQPAQVKPQTSRQGHSTGNQNRVAKKAFTKPSSPRQPTKRTVKHDAADADGGSGDLRSIPKAMKQVESSTLLHLPRELLHKIFGYDVRSQCGKNAQKLGHSPSSPSSIIKQVCQDVVYEHEFQKMPPYGPTDRFLETPVDMQLVSKSFSYEYYATALWVAFKPGSIIHTTVADFNFDFLAAFLSSLEDCQVAKINTKKVKLIVRLEHEGFPWHELNLSSIRAFNKIVFEKFKLEDAPDMSSAGRDDSDDSDEVVNTSTLVKHSIEFELLDMGGSKRKFLAKVDEWLAEFPDDMGLLKPFLKQWKKEHSDEIR